MATISQASPRPISHQTQKVASQYWPFSDQTTDKIKKVAIGVIAALILLPLSSLLEHKIIDLMKAFNIHLTAPQEVIQLWNYIGGFSSKFLSLTIKTALLGYIVIFGPIIEEYLFRDKFHSWLEDKTEKSKTILNKAFRVGANGLIFGACHLSPTQGWTNIPIFLVISCVGFALAALREATGDTIAPKAAHIVNNGVAMTQFLLGMEV